MAFPDDLPRYRSHKEVRAVKIREVVRDSCAPGAEIVPADVGVPSFSVLEGYVRKHDPKPGGYFVLYDDGYQSFSPAETFESGYTRL